MLRREPFGDVRRDDPASPLLHRVAAGGSDRGHIGGRVSGMTTLKVTLQPPRFAWAANLGGGTVSIRTANASTGRLRANGYVLAKRSRRAASGWLGTANPPTPT